jgi:hypothetical protein
MTRKNTDFAYENELNHAESDYSRVLHYASQP